jgi:hypothetical protein
MPAPAGQEFPYLGPRVDAQGAHGCLALLRCSRAQDSFKRRKPTFIRYRADAAP